MVGPYRSTLTLADAKSKLKALGFDNLIVHNQ
jgi:cell division protein FtsN